jgi:uncharacterized protein
MKILISPAKSLNEENKIPNTNYTQPVFLKEAATIQKTLQKKKPKQLMELMDISEKLAQLNWERNQKWTLPFTTENARQAIYTFDGEVYTGLDVYSLPEEKWHILQDKVRILSGLYGVLKPLDLMQAYRLEMGTSIKIGTKKNLYEFWKKTITKSINDELQKDDLVINLASTEYFSVIDKKQIKAKLITPEFKDYKDGKLKMISFFAKKARGLMTRFIIDTNAETVEDIKNFDYEGYAFDSNLSTNEKLVFTR